MTAPMSPGFRDALVAGYRAAPTKALLAFRARWNHQLGNLEAAGRGQSYDAALAAGRMALIDHLLDTRGLARDADGGWCWTEADDRREMNAVVRR